MRRLVDKLMRIVLIKNFLGDDGDDQIDYSNVDSDDEDKKCWMLCLPCRVPPLRCHSMLQLHGYPLTTFIHDKKEEEAIMIRSMILTPHQDHHQIYWQRQVVALVDGKGVFFLMFCSQQIYVLSFLWSRSLAMKKVQTHALRLFRRFLSDPGPIIVYPSQWLTDWLTHWQTCWRLNELT